jgi:hypothetical protein
MPQGGKYVSAKLKRRIVSMICNKTLTISEKKTDILLPNYDQLGLAQFIMQQ